MKSEIKLRAEPGIGLAAPALNTRFKNLGPAGASPFQERDAPVVIYDLRGASFEMKQLVLESLLKAKSSYALLRGDYDFGFFKDDWVPDAVTPPAAGDTCR